MATFTVSSANINIDTLTSKAGNDTYNINGTTSSLIIDQHSRYGQNQTTSSTLGNITCSSTLGGSLMINGRAIWLIPYTLGAGLVPAYNTSITKGSASGLMIGVYSAINVAPTTPGGAMPVSGFILVKQWNGTAYGTGLLSGITATAGSGENYGWLEIVGADVAGITINRLNNITTPLTQGQWFTIGTTTGTRTTTYQLPTNGSNTYIPGVWVDNATPLTISTATWSSSVGTITTSSAHGWVSGQTVILDLATPFAWQGTYVITVTGTTTFTIPITSNPGTYVSSGTVSVMEFYPVTSDTAVSTAVGTDANRGKWSWVINSTGLVSFGYDGTNSSGGYVPPSGRTIRIGNVFMQGATTAAPTVNALNTTPSTRYKITPTSAGNINMDKFAGMWYFGAMNTCYALQITNAAITTGLTTTGPMGTPPVIRNLGVGNPLVFTTQLPRSLGNIVDTTETDVWLGMGNITTKSGLSTASGLIRGVFTRLYITGTGEAGTAAGLLLQNAYGQTINGLVVCGAMSLIDAIGLPTAPVTFKNTVWYTSPYGNGTQSNGTIPINVANFSQYILFDGFTAAAVGQGARTAFFQVGGSSSNVTLRNFGSVDAPIDFRDSHGYVLDAAWARSTTVITLTLTAHGLRANDLIYVYQSSDESAVVVGQKTVATVVDANNITFTGLNAGGTSGTLSFWIAQVTTAIATPGNNENVVLQNFHVLGHTGQAQTGQTSNIVQKTQNMTIDPNVQLSTIVNATNLNFDSATTSNITPTTNTAQYGSAFMSQYVLPYNTTRSGTGVSWARSSNQITVTNTAHGFVKNDRIYIPKSSDFAAVPWGIAIITSVPSSSTFVFSGLAGGATSGTLDYRTPDGRMAIYMNEGNSLSTQYTIDVGTDIGFTGSGGILMPTVSDQVTWTSPYAVLGYNSFPSVPMQMIGGTLSQYSVQYAIDTGSGYSSFKNLSLPVAGASGSSGANTITVTSVTGVTSGDMMFGQGIAEGSVVSSINTGTNTLTMSINNTAAVSGIIYANALPNESSPTSAGFNLKTRVITNTSNSTALTHLIIPATSTNTTRKQLYSQSASVTVTITIQRSDTLAAVSGARVYVKAASGGSLTAGTVILTGLTDINGQISTSFLYSSDQPITGWARDASGSPNFAQALIGGKITAAGYSTTSFLVLDE